MTNYYREETPILDWSGQGVRTGPHGRFDPPVLHTPLDRRRRSESNRYRIDHYQHYTLIQTMPEDRKTNNPLRTITINDITTMQAVARGCEMKIASATFVMETTIPNRNPVLQQFTFGSLG
jgi:hypothetical protein